MEGKPYRTHQGFVVAHAFRHGTGRFPGAPAIPPKWERHHTPGQAGPRLRFRGSPEFRQVVSRFNGLGSTTNDNSAFVPAGILGTFMALALAAVP